MAPPLTRVKQKAAPRAPVFTEKRNENNGLFGAPVRAQCNPNVQKCFAYGLRDANIYESAAGPAVRF